MRRIRYVWVLCTVFFSLHKCVLIRLFRIRHFSNIEKRMLSVKIFGNKKITTVLTARRRKKRRTKGEKYTSNWTETINSSYGCNTFCFGCCCCFFLVYGLSRPVEDKWKKEKIKPNQKLKQTNNGRGKGVKSETGDACRHSFKQKTVRTPVSQPVEYNTRYESIALQYAKWSEVNYAHMRITVKFFDCCVYSVHSVCFYFMFSFRFYSLIEWKKVYIRTHREKDR